MITCAQCAIHFEITQADRQFYAQMEVPAPTQCPRCRMKRRLAFRNDVTLYQRTSSLSGKPILAIYPEDAPFPVYDHDEWWGEGWDPLRYGREIDFSRPFFPQWQALRDQVPRLNLFVDNLSVNSEYSNQVTAAKNNYMIFSGSQSEDCYYGYRVNYCRNSVDNLFLNSSEQCYECIDSADCYQCRYVQKSSNCRNSAFLYDCQGCNDCFMSFGLRNKSYYYRNQPLSQAEYRKKLAEHNLGSRQAVAELKQEFQQAILEYPRKYANLRNIESVTGDNVSNAKDCRFVFDGANIEQVRYAQFVQDTKDSMDLNYGCDTTEWHYEVSTSGINAYHVRFSIDTWPTSKNLDYCDSCSNGTSDCFGCIGLRKQQYCILNKQYAKDEYHRLVAKLIAHMKETGEWGEFFPVELSPFAYNESTAQLFFPLNKSEVEANGWRWKDQLPGTHGQETVAANDVPDAITDVPDDFERQVLACAECGKNYKIMAHELSFYNTQEIPVPDWCPQCRLTARLSLKNPPQLFARQCDCSREHAHHSGSRCPNKFETSYQPDQPETVYCEECYQFEVY